MAQKFITTSIAYINAEPHIGFLFELLAADVLKRAYQAKGDEVFLLTGTDEHGVKVAQAAEAAGMAPAAFADQLSKKFAEAGSKFRIGFDYFIRTTNPDHVKFVQEQWTKLSDAGVLKKKTYSGLYCSGCEAFKTDAEIKDGRCLIHDRELEKVDEENWFLVVDGQKKGKIEDWIRSAVQPETRQQEVVNVLASGAYDEVSVSRPLTKNSWGVPVPGDAGQIMYVWVDALFNYISALRINNEEKRWPADVQVVGKDILKFHAIIWPALLLATGYELPKKLLVHGFINVDGKKMSKSIGNVIAPASLVDRYGVEASRYLLLRGLSFYDDSNFTWVEFDSLYTGELANGLGNLVARLIGIFKKTSFKPEPTAKMPELDWLDFAQVLRTANDQINDADKIITAEKLWENPESKKESLTAAAAALDLAVAILGPVLPETAAEIRRQLTSLVSKPLFPRLSS